MKYITIAILTMLLISGCSTMTPARYSVSADTNSALKQIPNGSKVSLTSLSEPESYDANCRLMGPIKPSDGLTIAGFIQNAFNDELKFADLYDTNGIHLTGTVDRIQFSSSSGLLGTSGWWELAWRLNSPNGQSVTVSVRHEFFSGYGPITACHQTAQALGSVVQDLIKKTVMDPSFSALIR